MKTTEKIKEKLEMVRKEVIRISEVITNDENMANEPYATRDGNKPEVDGAWTFNDALTDYVSQKLTLEWVLS
jgi:hypothetical protein